MQIQDSHPTSFDLLCINSLPKWKITFLKEIWDENKLSEYSSLREQVHELYNFSNNKYKSKDYSLSYSEMGKLFGVSKQRIGQLCEKNQKILEGKVTKSPYRQSLLSTNQVQIVKTWIVQRHKENDLPMLTDITDFVRTEFNLECSNTWVNKWVTSNSSGLYLIDAAPLEKERINVTVTQLQDYGKEITKELKNEDPRFLFNLDETGLDDRKYNKKTVVSTENIPICYKMIRPPGHITITPTICADGSTATPMIIIARKSMDNDLLKYAFPRSNNGYLVSSQKVYMTTDLFENYFETILIPHINKKRFDLNKPLQRALFIIEGFTAHSSLKLDQWQKDHNFKIFYIPPHSSHLTQPLDLLIFATFKKRMLSITTTRPLTNLSKRIALTLKGIQMSTNFFDIETCFHNAGFEVNLEPGKEEVTFHIEKILENDRAPENPIKKEKNKRKNADQNWSLEPQKRRNKKQSLLQMMPQLVAVMFQLKAINEGKQLHSKLKII